MTFIWAAVGLAALHALSPGHWLPYAAAGRAGGWGTGRTLRTALAGLLVHLLTTVVLAGAASLVGFGLVHTAGHGLQWLSGLTLLAGACWFLWSPPASDRRRWSWLVALGVSIHPCLEVVPLLLAAAVAGPALALAASTAWALSTLAVSLCLVAAACVGLPWEWVSQAPGLLRMATGAILLLSGTLAFIHTHP